MLPNHPPRRGSAFVNTAAFLLVGILALPGVYNTEFVAPIDVFDHVRFHSQPRPGMKVVVIGPTKTGIRSFEGTTFTPDYGLDDAPKLDVLVIPSAEGNMGPDLENAALLAKVKRRVAEASLVLTLCDGAFVLAATGALDGRQATTFPGDREALAKRFPKVRVRRDVSWVWDGKFVTSAGGVQSFDAALAIAERLYGREAADSVAEGLVIDWPAERNRVRGVFVSQER
jgi:transcriptional regulator GlxA family with amidase domain